MQLAGGIVYAAAWMMPVLLGLYICTTEASFYRIGVAVEESTVASLVWRAIIITIITVQLMLNTYVVSLYMVFKLVLKIFLGELRSNEIENLTDNLRYTIPQSILMLAMFRNSLSFGIAIVFLMFLAFKSLHWVADSRVEASVEHVQTTGGLIRMMLFLMMLLGADCLLVYIYYRKSVLLLVSALHSTLVKVVVMTDNYLGTPQISKGRIIMTIDMLHAALVLATMLIYMGTVMSFAGLPIHLMGDTFSAARTFILKMRALSRYSKIIRTFNTLTRPATHDDIERDSRCPICLDTMDATNAVALSCSHVFHRWLEKQQLCPTCRSDISTMNPARVTPQLRVRTDTPRARPVEPIQPFRATTPPPTPGITPAPYPRTSMRRSDSMTMPPIPELFPMTPGMNMSMNNMTFDSTNAPASTPNDEVRDGDVFTLHHDQMQSIFSYWRLNFDVLMAYENWSMSTANPDSYAELLNYQKSVIENNLSKIRGKSKDLEQSRDNVPEHTMENDPSSSSSSSTSRPDESYSTPKSEARNNYGFHAQRTPSGLISTLPGTTDRDIDEIRRRRIQRLSSTVSIEVDDS